MTSLRNCSHFTCSLKISIFLCLGDKFGISILQGQASHFVANSGLVVFFLLSVDVIRKEDTSGRKKTHNLPQEPVRFTFLGEKP